MRERAAFIEVRMVNGELRRMENGRCISILAEIWGNGKGDGRRTEDGRWRRRSSILAEPERNRKTEKR
jgi:hypothetical protein